MRSDTRAATRLVPDWEISSTGDQFKTSLDVGLLEKVEKGFGSQKSGSRYLEVGSWQLANAECLDDIAKLWIVRNLKMEDMEFGRISIYEMTTTSSDKSIAESIDAAHQTSIDDTPPKAERERRVDSMDESPLAKIKESLDSLHSALEGQNQFRIYQIDDDTLSELEQRVDFVDNPTLKDMYPIPNPDSFTQNYDATVGSRGGRAKFRLNQALTGNHKMATDLNGKIDMIYSELMRKFDALSEHIKRLDGQVAENAIAIKRETRRLPGRTDANPKRQINDVSLRSGRSLNPSTIEINQAEKHADFEKTGENRSRPLILDGSNPESETPWESERSDTKDAAIDLEEEEEELEID
ncbi:hypothetical protein F2Q69_00006893 [Brassica cretica]|uniref:Uncharacterized protein n=1 Tax=Brassica cretica TaxID=69181 RepID=A0A8S9P0E4_BRACR|nr:hypothetical protein F2Q69_00006893 [Brassica cretica]